MKQKTESNRIGSGKRFSVFINLKLALINMGPGAVQLPADEFIGKTIRARLLRLLFIVGSILM